MDGNIDCDLRNADWLWLCYLCALAIPNLDCRSTTERRSNKMNDTASATTLQLWGAGSFGVLIGWYVYYINRYRKGDVQMTDLVTLIGVIGGGAVVALFPAKTDLFGAYGIGLGAGFFGYFLVLCVLVTVSKNFDVDFFLDGRRKKPADDQMLDATGRGAMSIPNPQGRN